MAAPIKYFGSKCQIIYSYLNRLNACRHIHHAYYNMSANSVITRHTHSHLSAAFKDKKDEESRENRVWCPTILCAAVFAAQCQSDEELAKDKAINQPDDKDELIQTIKRAKLAEMKQNFKDADELYHKALAVVNMYGQNKTWAEDRLLQGRVYIYDSMANLALSLHQFEKAESLFKETMRGLLQQGFTKTDNAVLEVSLKLAMIYAMLQRLDEADKGYGYCIKLLEEKVKLGKDGEADDDTTALLGISVDSYARFLMVQSKYPESLENMKKALDLATSVFGEVHPQVAVIHNDMSTVLSHMEEYDLAREHSAKAITIAHKTNSPDMAAFLCNMGSIYMYKMDFILAEKSCKKALNLSERTDNSIVKEQAESCLQQIKEKMKNDDKKDKEKL